MSVEIIEGDCLDVLRGMDAGSVDAVVTDPPFGARRPSARRLVGDRFAEVSGNDCVRTEWLPLAFAALKDGGAAYVFTCWDKMPEWRAAMTEAGFRVRSCIVWNKLIHGLADLETCWAPQHEFILFGAKGRHELRGKRPIDIIHAGRVPANKLLHPYQKPVEAIRPLIRASTDRGDLVVDPFSGSGTTGVVCAATGRRFIGVELNSDYAAIGRRRVGTTQGVGGLFAPPPTIPALFAESAP